MRVMFALTFRKGHMFQPLQFKPKSFALFVKLIRQSALPSGVIASAYRGLKGERDFSLLPLRNEVGHAFVKNSRGQSISDNPLKLRSAWSLILRANARRIWLGVINAASKIFLTPLQEAHIAVCDLSDERMAAISSLSFVCFGRLSLSNKDAAFTVDVCGQSRPIDFSWHASPVKIFAGILHPQMEGV